SRCCGRPPSLRTAAAFYVPSERPSEVDLFSGYSERNPLHFRHSLPGASSSLRRTLQSHTHPVIVCARRFGYHPHTPTNQGQRRWGGDGVVGYSYLRPLTL